jgi:hypothetical protein
VSHHPIPLPGDRWAIWSTTSDGIVWPSGTRGVGSTRAEIAALMDDLGCDLGAWLEGRAGPGFTTPMPPAECIKTLERLLEPELAEEARELFRGCGWRDTVTPHDTGTDRSSRSAARMTSRMGVTAAADGGSA